MAIFSDGISLQRNSMMTSIHSKLWMPVVGTTAAFPSAPTVELERIIKVQRDRDAKIHRHVLDILGPVCSMCS